MWARYSSCHSSGTVGAEEGADVGGAVWTVATTTGATNVGCSTTTPVSPGLAATSWSRKLPSATPCERACSSRSATPPIDVSSAPSSWPTCSVMYVRLQSTLTAGLASRRRPRRLFSIINPNQRPRVAATSVTPVIFTLRLSSAAPAVAAAASANESMADGVDRNCAAVIPATGVELWSTTSVWM